MAVQSMHTVMCDECLNYEENGAWHTIKDAKGAAAASGWVRKTRPLPARDLCPSCAAKEASR